MICPYDGKICSTIGGCEFPCIGRKMDLSTSNCNIKAEINLNAIYVNFNNILHLYFRRSDLLALQSWTTEDKNYFIELTFNGGHTVLCEYDDVAKWEAVLKELKRYI